MNNDIENKTRQQAHLQTNSAHLTSTHGKDSLRGGGQFFPPMTEPVGVDIPK
jgi:hypothetical protein